MGLSRKTNLALTLGRVKSKLRSQRFFFGQAAKLLTLWFTSHSPFPSFAWRNHIDRRQKWTVFLGDCTATQKSVKAEFDGHRWRLVTASPVLGELAATRFRDFWKE